MNNVNTIVIVDDHEIFRLGLISTLNKIPFVKVIGEASNSSQLFDLTNKQVPDIVFMDIDLGEESGIELTRAILSIHPQVSVIAITSSDELTYFNEMIEAGANGFLLKNIAKIELNLAIREIIQGNMYFSMEFLLVARQHNPVQKNNIDYQISEAEKEVLRLVCQGYSIQEISNKLCLNPQTVDFYHRTLLAKTKAKNKAEMILISFREGLINCD